MQQILPRGDFEFPSPLPLDRPVDSALQNTFGLNVAGLLIFLRGRINSASKRQFLLQ